MSASGFWWLITWACVAWYSTLTVYVAVKGAYDIKKMLAKLQRPDRGGLPREEALP
jgi:hypothetical protein